MRHRFISLFSLLPVLSLFMAVPAFAHHLPPGMEEVDEFADVASFLMGFIHPLTGLDHLLAALFTGVVAAGLGKPGRKKVLAAALAAMLSGGLLAKLPASEAVITGSVLALALMAFFLSARALQTAAAAAVIFQVWHGNAHAMETPLTAARGCFLAGACAATGCTMIFGLALTSILRRRIPEAQGKVQTT